MCQENWGARAQCTEGSTKVINQSKLRARAPEHMTEASQLHSPTSETDAPCPRGALAPLTASLKGTTTHSRAGNGNSWTSSTPKPSATQIPFPGTFQRWGFNWLVQDPSTRQLSAEWSPDVLALKSLSFNRTLLHSLLWLGAEEGQLGAGGSWASLRWPLDKDAPFSPSQYIWTDTWQPHCVPSLLPCPFPSPPSSLSECYPHPGVWTYSQLPKASWDSIPVLCALGQCRPPHMSLSGWVRNSGG